MFPLVAVFTLLAQVGPVDPEPRIAAFEAAFASRNLNDFRQSGRGAIKVRVRHAIKEGRAGSSTHVFRTLDEVESWLRSLERGGTEPGEDLLPRREVRLRRIPALGVVEYENQGIAHNRLYLSRIRYSNSRLGFRINEIELYDGD